uniref:BTB domain-containing protein n=1 Tax=Tetranychus urticae TaxID=32264 RepID=T1KW92_TETUR
MEIQEDASSLLLRAYKTGKWSDITIMNGDKKYRVHKLILSDVIPYFDRMFSSGLSESTKNAVDLFHLADYMNIPKLTALCLDFLWNESSDSPYIDVGHWINQIATEEVLKSIDQYIRSNFRDIVHTNSFLDYDVDTVTYMINLDNLNIDNEMQIFDAIMRWIRKNVERRSQLTKMLKIVHWVDINGVQFMDKIDKSWIMDCDPARHVIMAALELSFFKSLKTIQINDVHFGPRNKSDGFHYAVYRNNDSSIDFHHFDRKYESINLSENPFLPAANFGDSNITEHIFDSDAVIRIDWKHKNYRLFKDSDCCYTLLFGRLFQCNKERSINAKNVNKTRRRVFVIGHYHRSEEKSSSPLLPKCRGIQIYKNSEMEHMCCLYFHSTGSELWIFFNESESGYDKTIMQVFRVEDGQLIPVPVSHNPICSIVTDCKMIGLISLEAKH